MKILSATAQASPNIAFIKYWGNRDAVLRIPANGSISMNLEGLETRTMVTFDANLRQDQLTLNGQPANEEARRRVSSLLDQVRLMAGINLGAQVESRNNFPTGAGIASSASAFAALSLAASAAAGLQVDERERSRLARRGSGSACRSVPGGFVEWRAGTDDESSYAYSLAPAKHWDLVDCVAVVSHAHKPTGSTQGHALAESSPLQAARVASAAGRLEACRNAIVQRDFAALAAVAELDCNLMHAVMMTSQPPLLYWQPATLAIMHAVQEWRAGGLPVFYTIDAGPNVHVLCPAEASPEVTGRLRQIEGVKKVLNAHPGGPARLV
jgi:diphosphomevalonate decarboxylase